MSTGKEFLQSTASFGRFSSTIGLVFSCLLGIMMIAGGIYLLNKKFTPIQGTVIDDSSCTKDSVCSTHVKYTINSDTYDRVIGTVKKYYKNSPIELVISTSNQVSEKTNTSVISWVLIGVGILIILGSAIHYYAVIHYPAVAVVSGAAGEAQLFKNLFA
jgi:hypothetical protein